MTLPLETRVEIGKEVKSWIDDLTVEVNGNLANEEELKYWWQEFVVELQRRGKITSSSQSPFNEMTDLQGDNFGKALCPFNKYKDIAYRAVSYDYLAFIVDSNKELERYLKWRFKKSSVPSVKKFVKLSKI